MATFRRHDDVLVRCPYVAVHLVRKSRLQAHMVKCREHCIGEDKKICPFNATHCIPVDEFQDHLKICEDKAAVDKKVFEALKQSSTLFRGRTAVPSYSAFRVAQTEDWDRGFSSANSDDNSEKSFKSENAQLCNKLQTEQTTETLSSQSSDVSEDNGTNDHKNDLSDYLKPANCIGMGRGQAMLKLLRQSSNHNSVPQSKNGNTVLIGRGRGSLATLKSLLCAQEYHSAVSDEENSVRSESSKSEKNSSSSSSSCSSPKSDRNHAIQHKDHKSEEPHNFIPIGRGQLLSMHHVTSADQDRFQKHTVESPQSGFHQNKHSVGRARAFVSDPQRKRQFLNNSRIAVAREELYKMNNILSNKGSVESLKYDIEHLPPCRPGEIRSVPLFCE